MCDPRRSLLTLFLLGALLGLGPTDSAQGQDWLRTVEIRVPVAEEMPTRALVDSVEAHLSRTPSVDVHRVQDSTALSFSDLEDLLLDEGLSLGSSATDAFLRYRLTQDRNGEFHQEIVSMALYYSPQGEAEEDTPLLFASSSDDWFHSLLSQEGTPLSTNQAALQLFRDKLDIGKMLRLDEAEISAFGGETLREQRQERKQALRKRIVRMTY
ncbi:MAG: hypothetical protein R6T83_02950 [Salinibacter sp.]